MDPHLLGSRARARGSRRPKPASPLLSTLLLIATALPLAPALLPGALDAASLRPTRTALLRQVDAARQHGYLYTRTTRDVRRLIEDGQLVRLRGNRDYEIKESMALPYARPEVESFVERLGRQYRERCGEQLVVTSLIRPKSRQPRNSSPLSVHPTGMAIDLRVSWKRACRGWLEGALLQLEEAGVVEAARERYPPHYHVVLFPRPYRRYEAGLEGHQLVEDRGHDAYRVQRGDNLWRIARRHGTTVRRIQQANGLRSTTIKPGQVLAIPRD